MCGIAGIATSYGRTLSLDARGVLDLSEAIAHRGPDGSGAWSNGHVAIAHRRLSVVDLSPGGAQPMVLGASHAPRLVLAYNGELYNDAELRTELGERGIGFETSCDTETLLRAIEVWGLEALHRLRGMFAFVVYDPALRLLTLVRDPLGIKPMYFATHGHELIFASEATAILRHPLCSARPDWAMISAYATTIRTVLGNRTMFEGVHALGAGQMLRCDLSGEHPVLHLSTWWNGGAAGRRSNDHDLRGIISDSVYRHLRADVPTCALLSGGLDSTITATLAHERIPDLLTYCAGAPSADEDDDLSMARRVARDLRTRHAEAIVEPSMFHERWAWMIDRLGVPMSTPNEVAIHAVASRLRADGCVVTISGEGADELFGGYALPLDSARAYIERGGDAAGAGEHELNTNGWMPLDFKPGVFRAGIFERAGNDDFLRSFYAREMELAAEECGGAGGGYSLETHLRFQRRINLTGLLGRLDTATMLAGVEGRTPFADVEVMGASNAMGMAHKFEAAAVAAHGATMVASASRTKIGLRRAFADIVPEYVMRREKASFPLPFREWIGPRVGVLRKSAFARRVFRDEAIDAVCADPMKLWNLAWPMMNISMWGDRWWG